LDRKPNGSRLVIRPRHRWEGKIKMDLRERQRGWTGLIWLRIKSSGELL
jgi:hypothetical protein